ncbi:hypothetical protein JR316_0003219 [Psilocybe cubensis]|uniref:Uncharacterized protein n=1 Tax=Psilocybe cubensis TaxID=181762 RepID=A0ACB8H740_PSICU|nr:hypothetical protein JR316_0003219 [Psilocybe cubensis]KAH9483743.1 hypothetical protein JR316_0003219 [Psilocybe cubensis]
MSVTTPTHRRTLSQDSTRSHKSYRLTRSPSPPTQTFHPSHILHPVPTPALVESVAGGAHYAGARVDSDVVLKHRRSSGSRPHTVLKHDHEQILKDLTELYSCRPTLDIFERSWSKDAEFEDPFCKCKGFDEYAAQPKLFSKSEQISQRIMSSTDNPNQFIYHQTQQYTTRLFKKKKVVESIISVEMDDNEKIIRLVDRWDGKDLPSRYGATFLRVMNGKVAPWIFKVPKVKKTE